MSVISHLLPACQRYASFYLCCCISLSHAGWSGLTRIWVNIQEVWVWAGGLGLGLGLGLVWGLGSGRLSQSVHTVCWGLCHSGKYTPAGVRTF